MKIGILITGHPPEELTENGRYDGYFERLLGEDTFTYAAWAVVDGEMPADVRDADGWLITGSRHGAYEDHDWIAPLEAFIQRCYGARVPMIGVCFGHQIIAQAMGGKVEKFAGGWSVGAVDYQLDGTEVTLNAWHQDQVVEKPPQAKTVSSSDFCAHAALLYDDLFWTIQPHPEYGSDFIEGLMTYRGEGIVPTDRLETAKARLGAPLDNARIGNQMAAFFKKERA